MPVGEEEADARGEEDTLLHWETLFVVPACDAEDVAFPFVAEGVALDFLRDFLVVEYAADEMGGECLDEGCVAKWEIAYYRFSSSRSRSFWAPVAGSV